MTLYFSLSILYCIFKIIKSGLQARSKTNGDAVLLTFLSMVGLMGILLRGLIDIFSRQFSAFYNTAPKVSLTYGKIFSNSPTIEESAGGNNQGP